MATPMAVHTAGMPHSLEVLIRTGTRYQVASENTDPQPQKIHCAAVQHQCDAVERSGTYEGSGI